MRIRTLLLILIMASMACLFPVAGSAVGANAEALVPLQISRLAPGSRCELLDRRPGFNVYRAVNEDLGTDTMIIELNGASFGDLSYLEHTLSATGGASWDIKVVKASVSASIATSITYTANTTYTFKIPYRKKGRPIIQMTENRYKWTDVITYHTLVSSSPVKFEKRMQTVNCAGGSPRDYTVDIQLKAL